MLLTILTVRIKSRAILLLKLDLIDELRPIMAIKSASISYVQVNVWSKKWQIVLKWRDMSPCKSKVAVIENEYHTFATDFIISYRMTHSYTVPTQLRIRIISKVFYEMQIFLPRLWFWVYCSTIAVYLNALHTALHQSIYTSATSTPWASSSIGRDLSMPFKAAQIL